MLSACGACTRPEYQGLAPSNKDGSAGAPSSTRGPQLKRPGLKSQTRPGDLACPGSGATGATDSVTKWTQLSPEEQMQKRKKMGQ